MKGNGPNSPQTVRGLLNRRSQRAILDTRAHQEADILMAPMAAPFGKGFHKLSTPAGTEYTVGDASGMTFAPNAQVMVANPGGLGHRAVLGKAPPNRNGGAARSRNPRRRGTVVLDSNQYAFGFDTGGDLVAMLYADNAFASTRATSTGNSNCVVVGCILTDSTVLVGDGSAILYDGTAEEHKVWDVDGGITYSYSAPAGWSLLSIYPRYYDGLIYWVEYETGITGHLDATGQFRLRSAATDLTGAATIATVTMTATDEAGFDHFHDPFMHGAALMVDADGAVVYAYADAEVSGHGLPASALRLQYRIALSGAASAGRNFDADTYPILDSSSTNYPTAGLASGGFYVFDGTDLIFKTDDASAEAALSATPSVSGTPLSMNIGPNGTTIQVCHGNGYANFHIFRNNTLIASSVDAFDGTQDISAMFYYGAT